MKRSLLTCLVLAGSTLALPALAQSADISPVLLLETRPSDMPGYRRMVSVKYLAGDQVQANYTAYNRAEFRQTPNQVPANFVAQCARGAATPLREIRAFEQDEARRARSGETPETRLFCIKNVSGWKAGNQDRYLDPIFNGMPHAATLK